MASGTLTLQSSEFMSLNGLPENWEVKKLGDICEFQYGKGIKGFPVPICDAAEQQRIVEEIESRLSVCDKLEESIETSLKQSEALRQSILKQAFEGKLV